MNPARTAILFDWEPADPAASINFTQQFPNLSLFDGYLTGAPPPPSAHALFGPMHPLQVAASEPAA